MSGFLSKERIVAGPGYNRWWTILAALLINLSIGQAYAFSVFNIPLTRVIKSGGRRRTPSSSPSVRSPMP